MNLLYELYCMSDNMGREIDKNLNKKHPVLEITFLKCVPINM